MKRWLPANARSEFAKFRLFAPPPPPPPPPPDPLAAGAGALGVALAGGLGAASGLGAAGAGSGALPVPAGVFGSKNPSGLGMLDTSSIWRAATPASRKPGLSPTRG